MAINTSNNKVRIISTTVSGLTTSSKFSDIKSPALVVNTSEGGIFYADGSGGTSLKQLAALPNHTHSGYATTAQLANYLPLAGGNMTGPLYIKSENWGAQLNLNRLNNGDNWGPTIRFYADASGLGAIAMQDNELYVCDVAGNSRTAVSKVGHTHSDYLPKSGGTLTGTGTILGINRTDGNPIIGFNNNGNRLGWLGFNTSYEPIAQVLENDNFVIRKILHSGNYSNILAGGTINGSLTATSFIGNLTGNATYATSAGVSSEIICTGAGDNVDRPIVATNEANKLYYSSLVKLNYSTGNITAPKFTGNLIGNVTGNADSANVISKTYLDESINYDRTESKIRLIAGKSANSEELGYPRRYSTGLSVVSNYAGWQMVCYGSHTDYHPYYRSVSDTNVWGDWKQIAFTSDIPSLSGYATTAQLANYLPLTGGSISSANRDLLTLDSSDIFGPILQFKRSNILHTVLGAIPKDKSETLGSYWANTEGNIALFLGNNGKPYFSTNSNSLTPAYELLHSGNYSDYALPITGGTINGNITANNIVATSVIGLNNVNGKYSFMVVPSGDNTYIEAAKIDGTSNKGNIIFSGLNAENLNSLKILSDSVTSNGNITAPKFIGALQGNADSATKVNTQITSAAVHYPLLFGASADSGATMTNSLSSIYKNSVNNVYFIPSEGKLVVPKMSATSFIGNLTGNADSATTATKTGNGSILIYPENSNEINFGGTSTNKDIYFGYRGKDSRDIPRQFIFGGSTGTADIKAAKFIGDVSGNVTGNVTGNADSATKATNDSSGTAFIGNYFRKVTVSDNAANDFNSFENMTLTGRGDPKASCPALVNAPASWPGSGPAGGYGVLTYLWSSYGTQMAWGYGSNRIYIRNKYYTNNAATWSSTWDSLALSSDIPTKVSQLTNDAGYTTATGHTHDDYYSASASRTKNTVLAAPNGAAGKAVFRALVAADLPTVPVSKGGTGATSLTSGAALIGNGTSAVTTRSIKNMTTKGPISNYSTALMTTNTLAYWNGAYDASNRSNLTYCNHGAFGTIVTKNAGDYLSSQTWRPIKINNSEKLANSSSTALDISAGSNVTLTWNSTNNRVTIAATDTKYTHPASTLGTYDVDTSAKTASTLAHSGTFTVVTGALRDASGHISKVVTQQLTLPGDNNTDTKVTTSASSSKLFIIGKTDASKATASAANYNASVYIDGSCLYSGGTKVSVDGHTHSGYATTTQLANYLPLEGGTLTGNLTLYNGGGSVNSPAINFLRGTYDDTYYDWSILDNGGHLHFITDVGSSTKTIADFYESGLKITGDITANSFTGNLTGNVTGNITGSAATATTMSSFDAASGDPTKRYVWMSWSDNSGKPAYSDKLTFQTSTNTLFVNNKAVSLEGHTHSYLSSQTWRPIKINNSQKLANSSSNALDISAGSNVTLTWDSTNNRVTIAATNTKNTAGSSNKKTKIFVVGAASQNSTGVTTYSDVSVYITNGILYASNFITSSDERIKTNIKNIKNSEDSLGLRFVEFDYKDSSNHSAGHIAQEVKEVLPEFVHEDKGEEHMLSVDYTGLHSVQIKALLDRIIKLEEEIKQLKSSSR